MADDLSGAILDGRYRVIEPIAEGAMGVVYRAERVKLGRIVAIKVLHDQLPNEISGRKRFEIEAVAMAKLEHPHCAAVLDVGIHEDKPYVVMDFVSGENLKDVLAHGPLPAMRAVEIVRQVLSGLAHAHEHGIIHRDIKPANIVLSQKSGLGDHVKILDFGLARLSADASNLTTGIVVGTPSYMAPEQIRGIAIDRRTDLYACGVLLFELLTGKKPFHSPKDDPIEVCSMHLKQPPPTLHSMQPGIEFGELEAVVAKSLAKQPDGRYASAEDFAAALDFVPRRRAATPVAGVAIAAPVAATASGWTVPADPSTPTAVPAPGTGPTAVPARRNGGRASGPVSAPASGPASPPVDLFAPIVTPTPVTPTPVTPVTATPASGPTVTPKATSGPVAATTPPAAPALPGLPPTFDLSLAIPRGPTAVGRSGGAGDRAPDGAGSRSAGDRPGDGAGPGFDLALAPASEQGAPPILETPETTEPRPATMAFLGAPPAGPSPLAARDLPPVAEPVSVPIPPRPPAKSDLPFTRKQLAIAGGGVLALVIVIAIIASVAGGSRPAATVQDAAVAVPAPPPPPNPADDQLARAHEFITAGRPDAAIEQLLAARKVFPNDARLAYLTGKLYFAKLWWPAGLKQFRDTLRLDPKFRADPELIKIVLKGFITPAEYQADLGAFLRNDIGAAAKPYLEETATTHPRASTRARAAAELKRIP